MGNIVFELLAVLLVRLVRLVFVRGFHLVPVAIIADHQLAAWLQSVKELAEKILLVSYVQNCVPAEKASSDTVFARGLLLPVDNIVKVLWVGHQRRVFDIELHPVFHLGLHLDTVILSDCDHVGRQVHPVHVHPIPEK